METEKKKKIQLTNTSALPFHCKVQVIKKCNKQVHPWNPTPSETGEILQLNQNGFVFFHFSFFFFLRWPNHCWIQQRSTIKKKIMMRIETGNNVLLKLVWWIPAPSVTSTWMRTGKLCRIIHHKRRPVSIRSRDRSCLRRDEVCRNWRIHGRYSRCEYIRCRGSRRRKRERHGRINWTNARLYLKCTRNSVLLTFTCVIVFFFWGGVYKCFPS